VSGAARRAQVAARVLDGVGIALLVLALLWSLRGGLVVDWGPLQLTMSRPSRLLTEAFAVLLARQAVWPSPGRPGRLLLVLFLAGLLCGASGESRPRWLGDGLEYLAMSLNLARGSPPALTGEELRLAAATFGDPEELIRVPELVGADGRQDFPHFWFYPLLGAPFVRAAAALGVSPIFGFSALNLLLLCCAAWVLAGRLSPAAVLLVAGSPLVWWIDKAHTEVFTVSLLSIAAVLLETAPPWALPFLAAAAAQNPPVLALLALALAYVARIAAPRDPRLRVAVPLALGLGALHPLYYWWRIDRLSPLLGGTTPHLPSAKELLAVLADPNLGILPHFPVLALLFGLGVRWLVRSAGWRRPGSWLLLAAVASLLFAFAQTSNLNHGATPGPSRYGLWLIPFAVPVLIALEDPLRRAGFAMLAVASFVGSLAGFHPRLPESYLEPGALARWLWTKAPGLDNPLPEVFAERVGRDENWTLPVAFPRCEKALLPGIGSPLGLWPIQCPPAPLPAHCAEPGALCYANRSGDSFSFAPAPPQASFYFFRDERWYWRARPGEETIRVLGRMPWEDLRRVDEADPVNYVRDKWRVGSLEVRQSDRALAVWLDKPRLEARLTLRLPRRMTGLVVAPGTGDEYERLDVAPQVERAVSFPWVWPMALLLVGDEAAGAPP
jgi:hypothetical protein